MDLRFVSFWWVRNFFKWIARPGEAKKMSMTVQDMLTEETRS